MSLDYLGVLGLSAPASPAEVRRRFETCRREALAALHDPATGSAARERLEQVYLAQRGLRAAACGSELPQDELSDLRALIANSLEDGLLRHSRRQRIVREAAALGLSEFHAQLLIAQAQFGRERLGPLFQAIPALPEKPGRSHVHLAAMGLLTLALFMVMVLWAGR